MAKVTTTKGAKAEDKNEWSSMMRLNNAFKITCDKAFHGVLFLSKHKNSANNIDIFLY